MIQTFYKAGNYKTDHAKFGGLIYLSDFQTDHKGRDQTGGSSIAGRIARDQRFDEECKKNFQFRHGDERNE
jgi:hypothetical protein